MVLDSTREILFGNRMAANRFGDFEQGQDIVHLIRVPAFLDLVNKTLAGSTSVHKRIAMGDPVNETFDVKVSPFTVDEIGGNLLLLISFRDVSAVLQAEEMRSDFVANVSHELRSPLSSITGFIETLKGPAKNDAAAQTRFLDLMEQEAVRMARLIADLLSLSTVEAKRRQRPQDSIDVVAIAQQVQALLEKSAADQERTIELIVPEPIALIPGDADELNQVIHNLLENALKYSAPHSTITVTISIQTKVAGMSGSTLAIQVTDRGEGIAPQHLPRLTERFYRADSHRSRNEGGTGLGLAIVKHIVQHHRGRLKIESDVGTGSTFTIYLPTKF